MEQKQEYKRLEIEVIDYEYEDVITTSSGQGAITGPAVPISTTFNVF